MPRKRQPQSPSIADYAVCCSDRIDASERKNEHCIMAELLILTLIVILPACLADLKFLSLKVCIANRALCGAFHALDLTTELNTICIELFACSASFGVEACKTNIVLKGVLGHNDLAAELALIFLAVIADHVLHLFQLSTDCTLA